MQMFFAGLPSPYELEHLVRIFYPGARLLPARPPRAGGGKRPPLVLARAGKKRLRAAVRLAPAQDAAPEARPGGAAAPAPNPAPRVYWAAAPRPQNEAEVEYALCRLVYDLLRRVTGLRPPWGMMTGVRPVRILHDFRAAGKSEGEIEAFFRRHYDCSAEKFALAKEIADLQRPILAAGGDRDYSLYIGIPFCPSRCSYCSFVSLSTEREAKLMQPYLDALCRELEAIRALAGECRLRLRTIYIGGGTPTSLSADQLRRLMGTVQDLFDPAAAEEYTVEAGRPDCTTPEKLAVIKEYGATRVSINPQTFSDEVLRRIGRRHSAQDVLDCFAAARAAGHGNINMDLIAGLPGDTVEGFAQSLETALSLAPENITIHTLTLKRASGLVIGQQPFNGGADTAAMLEQCGALSAAGYRPYYLYRQKNTLQNLENTGWALPGREGLYNIYIMEEMHTILSAGAGGSTKLRGPGGKVIRRIFNYKYPREYLDGFETVLDRKKGVREFYARYLDPQTAG